MSTVSKPLEPVTIDLSDDDEDDCIEVSVKLPEKAVPKTNSCENIQKSATVSHRFLYLLHVQVYQVQLEDHCSVTPFLKSCKCRVPLIFKY